MTDKTAGKHLFAVDITETIRKTLFVYASDEKSAREDAEELSGDPEATVVDTETDIETVEVVNAAPHIGHKKAWSGGEDGDWVLISAVSHQ